MPLPIVAAVGAKVAGGAVKKAGKWLAGRLFGSKGKKAASTAITIAERVQQGVFPMPTIEPSRFGQQNPFPQPKEGVVGRTISRILPGGNTGLEFTPVDGTETDKFGRPISVHPDVGERLIAPRGYVIVAGPDGEPIAMLKGAARAMGLWSPRPKPPISGYDARAIRRAAGAKKRVSKLARKVGFTVTKK